MWSDSTKNEVLQSGFVRGYEMSHAVDLTIPIPARAREHHVTLHESMR